MSTVHRWRAGAADPTVPQGLLRPDYAGGSIVNLMTTVLTAMGAEGTGYAPLRDLPATRLQQARSIVLLVIDGLGYEHLQRSKSTAVTLHRHLSGRMTSVFPTTTATAITTFLTGLAPQEHGITGWSMYFKEIGSVTAVLPFRTRFGGDGRETDDVDVAALIGHPPVFDRISRQCHCLVPARIAKSHFNAAHMGGAQVRTHTSLAQMFNKLRDLLKRDGASKYIYAYWPQVDALSHAHGIASSQVRTHLAQIDSAFRAFLRSIEGTGTAVVVTADHGVIDSNPGQRVELDDHPLLAQTLMLPLCGDSRVAYCYVDPAHTHAFQHYVRSRLADRAILFRSRDLVSGNLFGLGAPHPRLLDRIGHYTLIMKGSYTIKDWVLGEHRYTHVGVHSGLSSEELYVPLILAQP